MKLCWRQRCTTCRWQLQWQRLLQTGHQCRWCMIWFCIGGCLILPSWGQPWKFFRLQWRNQGHNTLTANSQERGCLWILLGCSIVPVPVFSIFLFCRMAFVATPQCSYKGPWTKQPTVWAVWQGWHLKQSPFQLTIKTNGARAIGRLQDLESPSKNFLVMISLRWLLMLKNLCADSWGF